MSDDKRLKIDSKRTADTLLIGMILLAVLALGVVWFLRLSTIPLRTFSWLALGYALLYMIVALASDRIGHNRVRNSIALLMRLTVIPFLAVAWHFAGGVYNPWFLALFVVPLFIACATGSSWEPLLVAVVTVTAVLLTAIIESPQLAGYVADLGLPAGAIVDKLASLEPPAGASGMQPDSELTFAGILLFALLDLGSAAIASTLIRHLRRSLHAEGRVTVGDFVTLQRFGNSHGEAVVAVTREGGVVYMNSAAEQSFAGLTVGGSALPLLRAAATDGAWWTMPDSEGQVVNSGGLSFTARRQIHGVAAKDAFVVLVFKPRPQHDSEAVMFGSLLRRG